MQNLELLILRTIIFRGIVRAVFLVIGIYLAREKKNRQLKGEGILKQVGPHILLHQNPARFKKWFLGVWILGTEVHEHEVKTMN